MMLRRLIYILLGLIAAAIVPLAIAGIALFVALALTPTFRISAVVIYIMLASPIIVGSIMDSLLGDPNSYHPIVGFGRAIGWGERRLNYGSPVAKRLRGTAFNGMLVLVLFGLMMLVDQLAIMGIGSSSGYAWVTVGYFWLQSCTIFYMLSGRTLAREVKAVFVAADQSLQEGRRQVARIVGRDTAQLSDQEVRKAALETLSENLSDGVIAPMFWYGLLGLPGITSYKMINTQDSMIGYKNARYRDYGCFSARLDDVVNYIPARLTALLMLVVARRLDLLGFVRRHGKRHASPNSGYPEAALAGILGCQFGGSHDYFGETVYKPTIGDVDRAITTDDMLRAITINRRAERLMVVLTFIVRIFALYMMVMNLYG